MKNSPRPGPYQLSNRQRAAHDAEVRAADDLPFCPRRRAHELPDPEFVFPLPQIEIMQMIGSAYRHYWAVQCKRPVRAVRYDEMITRLHIPLSCRDLSDRQTDPVLGDSAPVPRAPAFEVWGYGQNVYHAPGGAATIRDAIRGIKTVQGTVHLRTAIWRVLPSGRIMIWLYLRGLTTDGVACLKLSEAAAIYEIAYAGRDGGIVRIIKGRPGPGKPIADAPAYSVWESSACKAVWGPLDWAPEGTDAALKERKHVSKYLSPEHTDRGQRDRAVPPVPSAKD